MLRGFDGGLSVAGRGHQPEVGGSDRSIRRLAGASALAIAGAALAGTSPALDDATAVASTSSERSTGGPTVVDVGGFVNEVYDIDLPNSSFSFNMYLWFRWDPADWPPRELEDASGDASQRGAVHPEQEAGGESSEPAGPYETFEVVGARSIEVKEIYRREGYCCVQVSGEVTNRWQVEDFPFDQQVLSLRVEDASYESSQVIYQADSERCGVSPSLAIPGSTIIGLDAKVDSFAYPTTFGDPLIEQGTDAQYSRFTLDIVVGREGWSLFLKLFTGLLVSTCVAMLAYWIDPSQVDPRFGVCVGGLFGIIASSYVVSSLLPDGASLAYSDQLHVASLVAVMLTLVESTVSLGLRLRDEPRTTLISRRLDRVTFVVVASAYVGFVVIATSRVVG